MTLSIESSKIDEYVKFWTRDINRSHTSGTISTGTYETNIITNSDLVVAGQIICEALFKYFDVSVKWLIKEGEYIKKASSIATIKGYCSNVLLSENISIKIFSFCCNIAYFINKLTTKLSSWRGKIINLGKNIGLKSIEDYCMKISGGETILDDDYLLNITIINQAIINSENSKICDYVEKIRKKIGKIPRIGIEVYNISQALQSAKTSVDLIIFNQCSSQAFTSFHDLKHSVVQTKQLNPSIIIQINTGVNQLEALLSSEDISFIQDNVDLMGVDLSELSSPSRTPVCSMNWPCQIDAAVSSNTASKPGSAVVNGSTSNVSSSINQPAQQQHTNTKSQSIADEKATTKTAITSSSDIAAVPTATASTVNKKTSSTTVTTGTPQQTTKYISPGDSPFHHKPDLKRKISDAKAPESIKVAEVKPNSPVSQPRTVNARLISINKATGSSPGDKSTRNPPAHANAKYAVSRETTGFSMNSKSLQSSPPSSKQDASYGKRSIIQDISSNFIRPTQDYFPGYPVTMQNHSVTQSNKTNNTTTAGHPQEMAQSNRNNNSNMSQSYSWGPGQPNRLPNYSTYNGPSTQYRPSINREPNSSTPNRYHNTHRY